MWSEWLGVLVRRHGPPWLATVTSVFVAVGGAAVGGRVDWPAVGWFVGGLAASVGVVQLVRGARELVAVDGALDGDTLRLEIVSVRGREVLQVARTGARFALSGRRLQISAPGLDPVEVIVARRALDAVRRVQRAPTGAVGLVDVESHDRVRLRLEPVFAPLPTAALAAFTLTALALGILGGAGLVALGDPTDPLALSVLLPALAVGVGVPVASAVEGSRVVRVELWIAGEQLVLRTATRLRTRERRLPLADLQGVELSGRLVVVDLGHERVVVPVPDRTPRTRTALVGFLQGQIARAAHRRGEIPADVLRLRDAGRDDAR